MNSFITENERVTFAANSVIAWMTKARLLCLPALFSGNKRLCCILDKSNVGLCIAKITVEDFVIRALNYCY